MRALLGITEEEHVERQRFTRELLEMSDGVYSDLIDDYGDDVRECMDMYRKA